MKKATTLLFLLALPLAAVAQQPAADRELGDIEPGLLAVTWPLPPTTAMRISWVAEEPGNWGFHCHLMRHMSWIQNAPFGDDAGPHEQHDHERGPGEGVDLLGGLVLGITVEPGEDWAPAEDVARRRLQLHIGFRDGVFGEEPGYGFVLQDGLELPAPDSVRFPVSPIVLTRGEPTEIVVRNHAGELTLRIVTTFDPGLAAFPREAPPPHTMDILVRVR